jgi:hypothetical protein
MKKIRLILFLLLLIPSLVFAQGELLWQKIEDFSGGLCDDAQSWKLADNEATDLLNIYLDEVPQGIVKRKGYEKANSTSTTSYSWLQTTAEDWNAGTLVNIDTYTASGTYRLKTSYWTQTSASDFASGTLVNIDTTTVSGSFRVAKTIEAIEQQYTTGQDDILSNGGGYLAQSFTTSKACTCTKIEIYIAKEGSPGDLTVYLKADNNNLPGNTLSTGIILATNVGTILDWEIANISDVNLTGNTKYWIYLPMFLGAYYYWWGIDKSNGAYAGGNANEDALNRPLDDFLFKVYEQHYEPSSYLVSQIGDLGIKPDSWGNFEATEELNGTTINWYVRTSSSPAGFSTFYPSWWTVWDNQVIDGPDLNRYVQWQASLDPSNTATPVVYDVTINGKVTGSLTSQSHDCTDVTQWGRLEANDTLNEQTITYAVRTSSYSAGLASATWYPVVSGNDITAPVNRYAQWISTLTSTGSQTPVVDNVTIYWYGIPSSLFNSPIRSLHSLTKSDASKYMYAVIGSTIWGSSDGASFTSVKTGMSTTYDVNWTNLMDSAYCVDGSTWSQKFTAYDSCTAVTTVPRGRFIIEEGYRLWVAYPPGQSSYLYYSALGNGATWSVAGGGGWVYIPGEGEITGLGKLQGSVIVYKTNSVWKVIGIQVGEYFVPTIVNLSPNVGCVNHRSIQNFRLKDYTVQVFLGKDNVYVTNGVSVVPIGDKIKNTIEDLKQATFASSYSWVQISAGDFGAGTSVNVDTTTVPGTIRFLLPVITWEETTTADFDAGVIKTNINTAGNELKLSDRGPETLDQQQITRNDFVEGWKCDVAQSFRPSKNCLLTKVELYVTKFYNPPGLTVQLMTDNGNYPGTVLASVTTATTVVSGIVTIDFSDTELTKDTRYWIFIPAQGTPPGYQISGNWYRLWTSYTSVDNYKRGDAIYFGTIRSWDFYFKTYEKHYETGNFRSREKTIDSNSVFGNFYQSSLSGQSYIFKVRKYSGTSWSDWVTVSNGNAISLSAGDKAQYDITLTSNDGLNPIVYDVKIQYYQPQTGYFISQPHDCGTQITHWGNLIANSILNNQIINYQVRTSSYSGGLNNATWHDVVSGGLIPALVNRFVQWKAVLTTTNGTETPVIDDVTIFWWAGTFSGSSPASTVYDDRYHLFAMTSGSDINDIDLVLNEYGAWVKHDIKAGSAVIYDDKFYTGSSTTTAQGSWIYKQDVGYSDDLQPINSYWQSKDYDLGYPYKDKTLRKIWTVTKRVGDYPLTMTYIIDLNRESKSYDVWLSSGQVSVIGDERHIGSEAMGKFFKFKVSQNGKDQPFELYRIDSAFQKSPRISEP